MTSRAADGGQEVVFYLGSNINSAQDAYCFCCLRLLKLIKLGNHKELLLSTKGCCSRRGKNARNDRKTPAKMARDPLPAVAMNRVG